MKRSKSKKSKSKIIFLIILFLIIGGGTFIGIQYLTKTGLFKVWGVITYDESLSESEISKLKEIFTDDLKLEKNLTISAKYLLEKPELTDHDFVSEILVPVTDFYNNRLKVTSEETYALLNDSTSVEGVSMIDLNDLSKDRRLLQIDDKYYLENFTSGAAFRIISFDSEAYVEEISPLVADLYNTTYPIEETVLSFAQTGVTALSRNMDTKLKKVGDATYFANNIKDFLSEFDLTHTSNESSFTTAASGSNICSNPKFIDTLTAIGLDIVELTGNHNRDCGDNAARDSVNMYKERGIQIFGGGATLDEAATPLRISKKDTGITLLGYNESTGGGTYDATPGANPYREEVVKKDIAEAKERGDFVIVDVQYYECYCYPTRGTEYTPCDKADWSSAYNQKTFFRHIIDLGADMVVGTSAHQPQTYELYGDGVIYYGLGNLFFDQIWWPGTTRGLILAHYFYDGKLIQTRLHGTVFGEPLQVTLMNEETNQWFLNRLVTARPKD